MGLEFQPYTDLLHRQEGRVWVSVAIGEGLWQNKSISTLELATTSTPGL